MNKINNHSNIKTNSASAGSVSVALKALFGFALILGAGTLVPAQALAWDCTLSASPASINEGDSSTLSWTTVNSTSFTIDNGVGDVTPVHAGSVSVSPSVTTTYTGTAHGPEGTISCHTTITVTPKPPAPTCTLDVSTKHVNSGDSATLSWTTSNATTFSLDNGIGDVTPVDTGSTSVSPTATTTYIGTATGSGGTVTCKVRITVCIAPPPPPPPPGLACTLTASPTAIDSGASSTLSWTTTSATSFSLDNGIGDVTPVAAGSQSVSPTVDTTYTGTATGPSGTVTCAAGVTINTAPPPPPPPPPSTGCASHCGGGGGGGSNPLPHVLLTALPHVGAQPLIYLSQIPYTGLDLGTTGTILYWAALIAWALALAYLVLFGAAPFINRSLRNFASRLKEALTIEESVQKPAYAGMSQRQTQRAVAPIAQAAIAMPAPAVKAEEPQEQPRGYSSYDGFKSFANNGTLSIDDIVKGLARSHSVSAPAETKKIESTPKAAQHVEPVYENVEPIYENIEPIMTDDFETPSASSTPAPTPAHVRGFVAALVEGDRAGVFSGMRLYIRGGGAPEKLIADTAFLLDDAYRARLDGTPSDPDTTRLVARLDTSTLEKLVTSLTTAIDSSYTAGVTGAKMALTRALAVLGA